MAPRAIFMEESIFSFADWSDWFSVLWTLGLTGGFPTHNSKMQMCTWKLWLEAFTQSCHRRCTGNWNAKGIEPCLVILSAKAPKSSFCSMGVQGSNLGDAKTTSSPSKSIKKHPTTSKYTILRKDGFWTSCPLLNESYRYCSCIWHTCPSWAACFHVPLGRFSKNPVKCYVEPKLAAREHFEILHSCCPVPADGWLNKGICIYDHLCTIPTSIELRPNLGNLPPQADVGASWGGSRSIPLQWPSPSDGYLSPRFLKAIWSIWEQKQTKQSCRTTFTISSVLSALACSCLYSDGI